MGIRFSDETYEDIVDFLIRCRSPDGGFGGGPGQDPHLAPTYAAVNALVIVGTEKALDAIEKNSLKRFFLRLREPSGAFRMHDDGEVDVRGAYCAISAAKLVNMSKDDEAVLFNKTASWIADCQTYEGGFGGAPGLEAHGGYCFCASAALAMLGTTAHTDLHALLRWTVNRQMAFEGGFQGRTNKLVDGCYSFWQGAILPIVQALLTKEDATLLPFLKRPLFHREALQEYILICCQRPNGGLIDKPGMPSDPYHTCYTLSGLSVAQHCDVGADPLVIGTPANELLPTHPVHNIPPKCVLRAFVHFQYNDESDKLSQCMTRESSVNTFERVFKSPSQDRKSPTPMDSTASSRESSNEVSSMSTLSSQEAATTASQENSTSS